MSFPSSTPELQAKELFTNTGIKYIVGDITPPFVTSATFIKFNLEIIKEVGIDQLSLYREPSAPWIIVAGSGTTGKSKLIPITHKTQRYRNEMSQEWLNLKRGDVVASMSHLGFHGPKNRLLETFWSGGSYFLDIYKEPNILQVCNKHLTVLHATVFHLQKLLLLRENEASEALTVRALTVGGSSVPFEIRKKVKEKLTNNLIIRYASNETGPISCVTKPEVFYQTNCVGKPLKGVELNILDMNNKLEIEDKTGKIAVQSPGNFSGYLGDDFLNTSLLTQYGFIVGDLGRFDEDGYLHHMGRADQMMIFNGINIYPAEIECVLLSHPMIQEAISFPIHHPTHQDIPVAAISLKNSANITEKEIFSYCKLRLGSHSPHRIFILKEMPRNERGKVVVENVLEKLKNESAG